MRGVKKYLVGLSSAALVLGSVAAAATASAASPASPPFSDIAGSSDQAAITFLASIGAINGVGNGLFDPTAPVTRAEFAKMVVNMLGLGNVATALSNETPAFKDAAKIPTWAWGYVNVAADDGIIIGYPNHTFGPSNSVTDAEAATMLIRAVGDENQVMQASVSSAWPGNYVTSAYTLGVTPGVNFVANLPATRGDIAQLMYNAALSVPVYVAANTTPVTYTKYPPLYLGGINGNSVGGFVAYTGTVTNVNSTTVSISYTGTGTASTDFQPACPTSVPVPPAGGSYTCAPSLNWASSYQLVGASSVSGLLNGTATILYDTNTGDVVYAALTSGATADTGTLGDTSTAVPTGYYDVDTNGNTPWIVTNSYACSAQNKGADTQTALASSVNGTNCTYYLLLGGTTPSVLQLASTSGSGTTYEVNPSSDGSDLGTAGSTAQLPINATYLTEDDTVSYTLNSSKQVTSVSETNVNDQIGVVRSTWCVSGCDNSISAGATPQIEISIGGKDYTLNVQPYTTLTLNGQTATLSSALDNSVAYVAVAGGYGTNTSGATNPGTGDGNAVSISLTKNQVTGTVTSVSTNSSASNAGTLNPGDVSSFTVQPASGSAATYTTDGNFSGTVPVGQTVTVALDASGEARTMINSVTSATFLASIVTSYGSSTNSVGETTYQIGVENTNGAQTFTLTPTQYAQFFANTNPSVFSSGNIGSTTTNNGAYLITEQPSGALSVTQMTYDNASLVPSGDYLAVVSVSGGSVVLGIYQGSGAQANQLDYAHTSNNPYVTIVLGDGFSDGAASVGFSGLTVGDTVAVYVASSSEGNYYDVVDTGNAMP